MIVDFFDIKVRRLFVLLMVALLPLTVSPKVYFQEMFDAPDFTSGIPAGWDNSTINNVSYSIYKWNRHDVGYEGACLRFNSCNVYYDSYNGLISPEITIPAGSKAELSCMIKNPKGGKLFILATTDNGATFDTLQTDLVGLPDWVEVKCPLAAYAGGPAVRLVFYSISNFGMGDAYHYLDNFIVQDPPLCAQPVNIMVSSLSQTYATINWTLGNADSNPDTYQLKVTKQDGTVVIENNNLVADGLSTMLTNLQPATKYNVILKGDCQSVNKGYSKQSEVFVFETLHEPVALPYIQNFDSDVNLPSNIYFHGDVSLSLVNKYGQSGNSMQLATNGKEPAVAVLPQIKHMANDMQLSFMVRSSVPNITCIVGMMSDPSDLTTFVALNDVQIAESSVWTDVRVNSQLYPDASENVSFAIMLPETHQAEVCFDNIEVVVMPSCPRPEFLKLLGVDSSSVAFEWIGKTNVLTREVALMTATDTTYHEVLSSPAVIDNIADNTKYKMAIREICAVGDTSEWSKSVQFRSECRAIKGTEFLQSFDEADMPNCWVQKQTINPTMGYGPNYGDNAWGVSSDYYYSAPNSLKLKDAKTGIHTLLISQPVYIDKSGKYDLAYQHYRNYSSNPDEGIRVWINDTPDTITAEMCGFIPSGNKYAPIEKSQGWYRYEYNIKSTGLVYIIFEGINQYASNQYIDDVELYVSPSCKPIDVKNVQMTNITANSALLTWVGEQSNYTGYIIQYKLVKNSTETILDTIITTGKELPINNLTPSSYYTFEGRIAAICGEGDTSTYRTVSIDFLTNCVPFELPLTESFENNKFPPICWAISDNQRWSRVVNSAFDNIGTACAKLNEYGKGSSLLITPQINVPADKKYEVSFYMARRKPIYQREKDTIEGVKVWVNSVPELSGATLLTYVYANMDMPPIEKKDGIFEYSVEIPNAGVQYVIFEGLCDNQRPIYIDDISVRPVPTCPKLRNFNINVLSHDSVIIDAQDALEWEVEYGVKGHSLGTGTIVKLSTSNNVLSGLMPDTEYDIYIRRVCGTETSAWSDNPVSCVTPCAPFEVTASNMFFEGFESFVIDDIVGGCYLKVPKLGGSEQISKVLHKDNTYNIVAYEGERFARQGQNYNACTYRQMRLKAGVNYEVSGYFIQEAGGTAKSTLVSMVISKEAIFDAENVLVSEYVGNKWTLVKGFFNVPVDGLYFVGWRMEQTTPPYSTGMDNLCVKEVNCIPPVGVNVTSLTASNAMIQWNSNATSWEILVSNASFCDPMKPTGVVFRDTVIDRFVDVNNLQPNTDYYYYLRSFCGEEISDWTKSMSFRTNCLPVPTPYRLDFENEMLPELRCWNITSEKQTINRASYIRHSGNASLFVEKSTLISPQFDVTSMANYMISGWVYASVDSSVFAVGVALDPNDINSYEVMGTIVVPKKNTWHEFTVYFSNLATPDYAAFAGAKHVALVMSEDNTTYYFDDILIEEIPSCPKPTEPVISAIGEDRFTLTWRVNGNEQKWRVVVDNLGNNVKDTIVTQNPCVISGLLSNTSYEVYLQAVCGASDSSAVVKCGNFYTSCGVALVPYTMQLRPEESGELPMCWSSPDVYSTCGWRTYVNTSLSLRTDCSNSSGKRNTVVSPIIDLAQAYSPRFIADIKNYYADSLFILVKLQDGSLDTIAIVPTATSPDVARNTVELSLDKYIGEKIRICFVTGGTTRYFGAVEIFTMQVDADRECLRPTAVNVSNVSDTSAVLTIVDSVAEHNAWEMACVPLDAKPESVRPILVTEKSYLLNNLQSRTTYDVYIRTKCADGQYSYWRGPIRFATTCGSMTLPYLESFENCSTENLASACFFINNEYSDGDYPFARIDNSKDFVSDGAKLLRLHSSANQPIYVVLPAFADPLNTLKVKFDYRNEGENYYNPNLVFGVVSSYSDMSTFQPVVSCDKKATITSIAVAMDSVVAPDFVGYLAFKCQGNYYSNYTLGIDNIQISSLNACPSVDNIRMIVSDKRQMEIELITDRIAPQYEVAYGFGDVSPMQCPNKAIFTSNSITLSNLLPGEAYTIYARSICGEGDTTDWSKQYIFNTLCDDIVLGKDIKFSDNFENYDYNVVAVPDCMYRLMSSNRAGCEYPKLDNTNQIAGSVDMYFCGNNALALPKFDLTSERLMVSFKAKGYGDLYIGVTNSLNMDSVKQVDKFYLAYGSSASSYVFDMSKYKEVGAYVVIYTKSYYADIHIDDLVIEWAPSCVAPKYPTLTQLTDKVAGFSWRSCADAVSAECRLINGTDSIIAQVNGTEFVIDTLKPNSVYEFDVRSVCSSNDTTQWSAKVKFTTLSIPANVPYISNFSNIDDNGMWVLVNGDNDVKYADEFIIGNIGTSKAIFVTDDKTNYKYTGPFCYDEYNKEYNHETFFAYRTLNLSVGEYRCDYLWKGLGMKNAANNDPYNFGRIFVMPDSNLLEVGNYDYANNYQCISERLFDGSDWSEAMGTFVIEKDGIYRLVLAWDQSIAPAGLSSPLAVDSICVTKMPCSNVLNLKLLNCHSDSVDVHFVNPNVDGFSEYYVVNGANLVVDTTKISSNIDVLHLGGLNPQTAYTLFVRSACADGLYGIWKQLDFVTECEPTYVTLQTPYFEGFENYILGGEQKVAVDGCWKQERSVGYEDFMVTNQMTADGKEPYEGVNYAILSYNTNCSLYRQFMFEGGQYYKISFWAKQSDNSSDCILSVFVNGEKTQMDVVATKKIKKFWQLVTCEYYAPYSGIYNVGILADVSYIPKFVCVDNISVENLQVPMPTGLSVRELGVDSAAFVWSGRMEQYQVQIKHLNTIVLDTIVSDTVFVARQLESATDYDVFVRAIDGVKKSDWVSVNFITDCDIIKLPYFMDFEGASEIIERCWDNKSGTVSSKPENWKVYNKNGTDVLYLGVSYALGLNVIKSNAIYVGSGEYLLSFDYMVASHDDKLTVMISNDGGNTYVDTILTSAVTDNMMSCTYSLVPFAGDTIVLAFASTASNVGVSDYIMVDNIRISCLDTKEIIHFDSICPGESYNGHGFYVPADLLVTSGEHEFTRLVRATSVGECDHYEKLKLFVKNGGLFQIREEICEGQTYVSELFPEGISKSGQYQKILKSSMGCDSIIELSLAVRKSNYSYSYELCEGDVYSFAGSQLTESGIYKDTLVSSFGCDSVITLSLNVLPNKYETRKIVCQGVDVYWQDTVLSTTGYYNRVFTNHLGCDSIVAIDLVVLPEFTQLDTVVCSGKSVLLGATMYSQTGTYKAVLQNSLGCDSVVTMNLTVLAPDTIDLRDDVCQGKAYYGNGFIGLNITSDTTIIGKELNPDGCFEVKRIKLNYIPTVNVDTTVFIEEGETYLFGGNSLTKAGKYDCTLQSELTGCDSVVHLTLVVTTNVDNVYALPLIIAPNPVQRGSDLVIYHDWTVEELEDLHVEVLDALGRIVQRFVPDSYPISINSFDVSGVYTVRVVVGNGLIYQGKVIVK